MKLFLTHPVQDKWTVFTFLELRNASISFEIENLVWMPQRKLFCVSWPWDDKVKSWNIFLILKISFTGNLSTAKPMLPTINEQMPNVWRGKNGSNTKIHALENFYFFKKKICCCSLLEKSGSLAGNFSPSGVSSASFVLQNAFPLLCPLGDCSHKAFSFPFWYRLFSFLIVWLFVMGQSTAHLTWQLNLSPGRDLNLLLFFSFLCFGSPGLAPLLSG